MSESSTLVVLGLMWLAYFGLHSALASLAVKRWIASRWPDAMRGYRLAFNLIAILLVLPPLALTYLAGGEYLWRWRGGWAWLANGLNLLALIAFIWTLRYYDTREFLGLRQWEGGERRVEDQEHFHLSPLHRFVRHPWYSLGLMLIWSRDVTPAYLLTAAAATAYFVVGSILEERKLMVYHGDRYRRYRERVPGLIPLPWRYLSREAAATLTRPGGEAGAGVGH